MTGQSRSRALSRRVPRRPRPSRPGCRGAPRGAGALRRARLSDAPRGGLALHRSAPAAARLFASAQAGAAATLDTATCRRASCRNGGLSGSAVDRRCHRRLIAERAAKSRPAGCMNASIATDRGRPALRLAERGAVRRRLRAGARAGRRRSTGRWRSSISADARASARSICATSSCWRRTAARPSIETYAGNGRLLDQRGDGASRSAPARR